MDGEPPGGEGVPEGVQLLLGQGVGVHIIDHAGLGVFDAAVLVVADEVHPLDVGQAGQEVGHLLHLVPVIAGDHRAADDGGLAQGI